MKKSSVLLNPLKRGVMACLCLAGFKTCLAAPQDYQLVYFDGHMHTTHSDGSGSLADIKSVAAARGLGAVIVTNHTKQIVDVNEWNDIVTGCAALSEPNFLMIPSFEVTGSDGLFNRDHFLAWGVYDPFVGDDANALAPEEVWPSPFNPEGTGPIAPESISAWMDYIHSHGGVAVHAHTSGTTQPWYGTDFIELYNVGHVKDVANYALMMGIGQADAANLGLVFNDFAIYGDRDLNMTIELPGLPAMSLRTALHAATEQLTGVGQWLGEPEADPLHSWDDLIMAYVLGEAPNPVFGVADSDAHNTANTLLGDPGKDDSDVGEAKNGVYVAGSGLDAFLSAVRAGRSFATTGPSLCMTVNGAMMGETARIAEGEAARIHLTMSSESQTAIIAKCDLYKNGALWQTLAPNQAACELDLTDTEVRGAGYYRVEVVSYDLVTKAYRFAWANPVFVNKTATRTVTYGWEDGGTLLGAYSDIVASNVTAPVPVAEGEHSLQLVDQAASGTPQAYVAWVQDLREGDTVTVSLQRYDTTPGAAPSCRLWGHYTDDANDIQSYVSSAGGQDSYGTQDGWDTLGQTWTFDAAGGTRTGLVIEVRTYSNPGDTVWVDDLSVTAPTHAKILVPGN